MVILEILGLVALGVVAIFVMWLLNLVVMTLSLNQERCRQCPLQDRCLKAISFGFPTLCHRSDKKN